MIYLDTSAFMKLIWSERETVSLQRFLTERIGLPLVSSALLTVEVRRAVLRTDPTQMPRADLLLTGIGQLGVTHAVLAAASRLPDPSLRSLDAIHLATALLLYGYLTAVVTYDKRLATAAEGQHLPVATPIA